MVEPGFPNIPELHPWSVVPWIVVVMAMVAVLATAVVRHRRVKRTGRLALVLGLAIVGALLSFLALSLPAQATLDTEGGRSRAECPVEAYRGTVMVTAEGKPINSDDFWAPCRQASRLRVASVMLISVAIAVGSSLRLARVGYSRSSSRA